MKALRSLIHHDFAEHDGEEPPPPVGDPLRLDVNVAPPDGLGALEMEARVEEGVVQARDGGALGGVGQVVRVLVALVRHVHRQHVQVVHVVRVGSDFVWNRKSSTLDDSGSVALGKQKQLG